MTTQYQRALGRTYSPSDSGSEGASGRVGRRDSGGARWRDRYVDDGRAVRSVRGGGTASRDGGTA